MRTLHVSAGGSNSRMKTYLEEEFGGIPKHLLSIPTAEGTILGQIIRDAESHFKSVTVWASKHNIATFVPMVPKYRTTTYKVDQQMTGPLGPLVRHALQRQVRTYGCAGDFFCSFRWDEMEKFHNMHNYPITILLARSSPALEAAVFECSEDGRITGWSRKDSSENDLINIGAYIIDPTPKVLELLQDLSHHKEDPFNTAAIQAQLMAGYIAEEVGFNVNTSSSYRHLLRHLES